MPKDHGIGARSKRREDIRFLTREGDVHRRHGDARGQVQCRHGPLDCGAWERSLSIDTSAAEAMPGRAGRVHRRGFRRGGRQPGGLADPLAATARRCANPSAPVGLQTARCATWATPMPAVMGAETYAQAKDAAEALAAGTRSRNCRPSSTWPPPSPNADNRVHDEIPDNLCFDWGWIEDNPARRSTRRWKIGRSMSPPLELVNNRSCRTRWEPRALDR